MTKKGKSLIIISTILLVVAIVLLCVFLPRNFSNLVSFNDVERIECKVFGGKNISPYTLTKDQERELKKALSGVSYKLLYFDAVKSEGRVEYTFYYKNGGKAILRDYVYGSVDSNGKNTKSLNFISKLPIIG